MSAHSPLKEVPRRRGGTTTLNEALNAFLKQSGLDKQMRDFAVYDAWRKALGPELCKRARAVQFKAGKLVVETESAAHRHELSSFTGESFRRRANEILGSERIHQITYKLKH
ncbi:MAG: DUF721 domain-containing protein [Planctomycetes bacterium]|nr:DUF721 domain-containing protein [Planctomycetota bacterium]